ncbi:MAG TPA: nucleotidyltransferase family protein [Pricia sp.]|nr:nucleotidyltransferase family protein [Pricia sp.]
MTFPKNIAIVILAAGASSRMGKAKQLLSWKDTTLLGHAIRCAKSSQPASVVVVLGANAAPIRKEIAEEDVEILENPNWESGLGSSIAYGVNFLTQTEKIPAGILVMLADQPLIDAAYLKTMITGFGANSDIVATDYGNRAGVPALFGASYYAKLMRLDDDYGARLILDGHEKNVIILNPESKTVDIDTKSDYDQLLKNLDSPDT